MPVTRKLPVRPKRGRLPAPQPLDMPITTRGWDRRAISLGILGTLVFHLLFFVAVPRSLVVLDPLDPSEAQLGRDLDLTLVDDEPEEQPREQRYVETNPEAPENEPDPTDAIGARNQQAANEVVPDELSEDKTPAREGVDDLPFDKIVSGTTEPQISVQPAPATREQQAVAGQEGSEAPMARNPPSGFEESRSDDPEGLASSDGKPAPNPTPDADEATEGVDRPQQQARPEIAPSVASPERPAPAPRPRLPRALPGPVKRQPAGVSQTGRTAVNAHFGPFGDYLERMQEAIQQRWDALGRQRSISESQTRVVLEFRLTREGRILDLETVDTTSQALGTLLCRSAVEQGVPYGEWSKEMVALLGDDEKITFTFYYW